MNRIATTFSAFVAFALMHGPALQAAEALLIPEVITREISIHVGGIQTPEIQYVESREVSLFIGEEPVPPYRQVESREVSLVVSDASPPPRIEELEVTLSPTGDVVTLDWTGYDQYAVRDVVRYDIYYSNRAFADITGMTPFASVGGENFLWTQGGFPPWQDHFFAVVPVDGEGNRVSQIVYFGGYPLMPETMTRELSLFIGAEPEPPYRQVESREVSLVVSDPSSPPRIQELEVTLSPTGDIVTLDWTGYDQWAVRDVVRYDIYYSDRAFADITGMTPFASVGGENFLWTQGGFPRWQDHFFAVVPVDGEGNQIRQIVYFGGYPLMPETMTREVSLFIGEEPEPPYRMVESREVGLVVADDTIPAAVTGAGKVFDANISEHQYGGVYLNWNDYDLWAQRDVIGYRIYYSDSFFSDVNESGVQFAGLSQDGLMATMVSGAFEPKVYYFAVVAEDAAGNFNPLVYSRSTKDPIPSLWEFALGNVKIGSSSLADLGITWSVEENHIEYRYSRRNLAVEAGTSFLVEWSEDLENWFVDGVTQNVTSDTGDIQNIKALVPRSGRTKLFVRLKVVPNTGQTGSGGQGVSVTPIAPPQITAQPTGVEILSGSTTTLSVKVNSTAPRTYQWYRGNRGDTSNPVGTNASTFIIPALTTDTRYWVRISNAAGSVDSAAALVKMATAPVVTAQPASVTIASGQTATLSVAATGSTPLLYQWYQGAVGVTSIPVGSNSASFTTPALNETTSYWVEVENWMGTTSSSAAIVTVIQLPTIVTQPSSRSVYAGDATILSVSAQGDGPLSYQWYQGDPGTTTSPVGTNSSSFKTPALTATTSFWVRISNVVGHVDSAVATLTVSPPPAAPAGFSLIPGGSFTMGRTSGDTDTNAPPMTLHVSSFYIGKFEVTKSLWDEVRAWGVANGYVDLAVGGGKDTNHPVQSVTWWDVVKWCNARSEKEGLNPCYWVNGTAMKTGSMEPTVNWMANGYRLPTEAEWEKAARGGISGRRFPWGTDTISHSQANYRSSSSYSYDLSGALNDYHPMYSTGSLPFTAPVGSFGVNGYGLHDMAGNVREWCWNFYSETYEVPFMDPKGPEAGSARVIRGGCWCNVPSYCRAGYRNFREPAISGTYIGFRLARGAFPPAIVAQPSSISIQSGSTATLTVSADGIGPITYQWYLGLTGDTTQPVGTNSAEFTSPTLTENTSYWVRVSHDAGSVDSVQAIVTVNAIPPSLTTQPASTSIDEGSTATLSVVASGTAPLTYQWYQGTVGMTNTPVGTNSDSFTTPALTESTAYWVRVSNSGGTVDSAEALVTVLRTTQGNMALIPAGSFNMGATSGDADFDAPSVNVSVSAFHMGKREVTKAEWDEVKTWAENNGYSDMRAGDGKANDHPVHSVSWWDAIKYCNARSQMEGLTPCYNVEGAVLKTGTTVPTVDWNANGYRLPTEAEWEKAARGGVSGKRFPWGTDTISHSEANYQASNSVAFDLSGALDDFHPIYETGGHPYTSSVGSFPANAYGLHDISGNVWEWCWDLYGAFSYVEGANDPRGAETGVRRVYRGGAWPNEAIFCRAAFRAYDADPVNPNSSIGFRVARSALPPVISVQPASTATVSGQTATLTVSAVGTAPFTYQWYQGAVGVTSTPVGSNSATFITPALLATTPYWVKVANLLGESVSAGAYVSVIADNTSVTVYPDVAGDVDVAGQSFPHIDITSVEVSNTATAVLFKVNLNGDPIAVDWGKYMIGISSAEGGDSIGNGWIRPIRMARGMNYWIGSWVDGGNGAQIWKYENGLWVLHGMTGGSDPGGVYIARDSSSVSIEVALSSLGLTDGDAFQFDVYTSGGGVNDGAIDALSVKSPSISNWEEVYSTANNLGIYHKLESK
jgi:formylglycine-generating enzyme